ncbi:cytochrome D1 domain-containing protein [Amphritea sp. HPY]|uniref:cytochrome D1 domain-containing protein n=1 Tax=Amphritea sp. HPY TaxID=3421652 RepID=UPI003D7DC4AB
MRSLLKASGVISALLLSGAVSAADISADTEKLYQEQCAACHQAKRVGGIGPALLPQNLKRLRRTQAIDVISNGRAASQMEGFSDRLTEQQISDLTDFIYSKPKVMPTWQEEDIRASQIVNHAPGSLPDGMQFEADPMNLFIVVEIGDHHATLLNGDTFEPIHRFKTRFALHGGPKFTPDGRYVFFASRDGWVSKFDIYNLKVTAEIRVGLNTRNIAVSSDGRYVLAGNYLPHSLVLLDAKDLSLIKRIDVADDSGKSSRISAVYNAPGRSSFVAALKDIPEIWELSYGDSKASSDPQQQAADLPVRRIVLDDYLDDFLFNQSYELVMGTTRPKQEGRKRSAEGQVVSLESGERQATLDLAGMPHLGSGITWDYNGRRVLATPNLSTSEVSVIDMESWETIKNIPTEGPGFFMRSHKNSPYAWVDVFFGKEKEAVHIIDKKSLEIVKTIRPAPGKVAAHVEFTKDGRYALLSIWDMDGALIVYDAKTLEEVKRLPMVKPSGKYNVWNKTHYEEGTSH